MQGVLIDRGTIEVDVPLLDYFEVGEKVKVAILTADRESPT